MYAFMTSNQITSPKSILSPTLPRTNPPCSSPACTACSRRSRSAWAPAARPGSPGRSDCPRSGPAAVAVPPGGFSSGSGTPDRCTPSARGPSAAGRACWTGAAGLGRGPLFAGKKSRAGNWWKSFRKSTPRRRIKTTGPLRRIEFWHVCVQLSKVGRCPIGVSVFCFCWCSMFFVHAWLR